MARLFRTLAKMSSAFSPPTPRPRGGPLDDPKQVSLGSSRFENSSRACSLAPSPMRARKTLKKLEIVEWHCSANGCCEAPIRWGSRYSGVSLAVSMSMKSSSACVFSVRTVRLTSYGSDRNRMLPSGQTYMLVAKYATGILNNRTAEYASHISVKINQGSSTRR